VANSDQTDIDEDRIGNACDICVDVFNPAQTDLCGPGSAAVPIELVLKKVQIRTRRPRNSTQITGSILIRATFDTTSLGGYSQLIPALHDGFAFQLSGAGLINPETLFFPACLSGINCSGPDGAVASFVRKGSTDVFNLVIKIKNRSFEAPPTAGGVTGIISVGGLDRIDSLTSCVVRGGRTVTCK
jgi:hypothetical protein